MGERKSCTVQESSSVQRYPVAADVFERHKETCQTTSELNLFPIPFLSSLNNAIFYHYFHQSECRRSYV